MLARHVALRKAEQFTKDFDHLLIRANLVGSLVRDPNRHRYVSDIDILVIVRQKIYHGPPLNLFYSTEEEWESGVLHWAIGKAVIQLKQRAESINLKFTQHGLFTRKRIPELLTTSANEICQRLGVPLPHPAYMVLEKGLGKLK